MAINYVAGNGGDGSRLPVFNRRVTALETAMYVVRTDVIQIVASTEDLNVGVVRLYERPLADYLSGVIVRDANTDALFEASTTYPPSVGKFYMNPYHGRMYFAKTDVGRTIRATYSATGSVVDGNDINWVYERAKAGAKPYGAPFTLEASAVKVFDKEIVMGLFELAADGLTATPSPGDVQVVINNPTNADTLTCTVKNNGTSTRTFLARTLSIVPPER